MGRTVTAGSVFVPESSGMRTWRRHDTVGSMALPVPNTPLADVLDPTFRRRGEP
jgi:hypothetical protein